MCSQREHKTRAGSGTTLALFAALLLLAGTVSAAETTSAMSGNTSNPCNGDTVAWSGTEKTNNNSKMDNSGKLHINSMSQVHGKGVGTPSALQYNVGFASKQNGKFPPGPVIFRQRTKVNSNGPADNFWETFFFRFNQDGSPGNTSFESDCRG